jgi:hypothetical protein
MIKWHTKKDISRREFLGKLAGGVAFSALNPLSFVRGASGQLVNDIFWVKNIPDFPFTVGGEGNYHSGVEGLMNLMGAQGLKFYRSSTNSNQSGPMGMIESDDVVLIKVNAQWKYRGCTNSDLIRGLIQRILDHPDGFSGEVVIFENGQGRGSLYCDTSKTYQDTDIHANANDESHSFEYLAQTIFNDPRVSTYLLDPVRSIFLGPNDHITDGYRVVENVSYPCFTSSGGHRIELLEGIWQGGKYNQKLKLINVPVLKHHDVGGSEITASLKHFYGVLSMADGSSGFRHYSGLDETCGKMFVSVRAPVLNIVDAIWTSHLALGGYPPNKTFRTNQILASQDPVALDYWAAKNIIYPIDQNDRHHPDFPGISKWLADSRDIINLRGGLSNPDQGIYVGQVTKTESQMKSYLCCAPAYHVLDGHDFTGDGASDISVWRPSNGRWYILGSTSENWGAEGDTPVSGDYNADGQTEMAVWRPSNGRWYIKGVGNYQWGTLGDIPVPGDYNKDGRTEMAVWRPSNGRWFIKGVGNYYWGTLGDIPVPGDYNGDGQTEIAVWRPSNGKWFIKGLGNYYWGMSGDIPVPGDYNGDGQTEIAVWCPSNGKWYIKDVGIYHWGMAGDSPVPGDYNGDGQTEIAIWRPSNGKWMIMDSGSVSWGMDGDIPLVR